MFGYGVPNDCFEQTAIYERTDRTDRKRAGKLPPNEIFNGKLVYFRMKSKKMKCLIENGKRAIGITDSTVKPVENSASRKCERQSRMQLSTRHVRRYLFEPVS